MIPISRPKIGLRERIAAERVLRSSVLVQGNEVNRFEQEFSEKILDGRPVVAVNSGTSALYTGLMACGITPGDEVIVPSFSFAATANSVVIAGGRPVFADINPRTFSINPTEIEELITDRTRAIMPVHLYGHAANMDAIETLANRFGLLVFEDAAQAHGASFFGQPVGTFGSFAMFSLYATKNMTSGEGGMICLSNDESARIARLLRNQGMSTPYANEIVGFNNRMTEVTAAIGREQLKRLPRFNRRRRANAAFFNEEIGGVEKPIEESGYQHVYHQYTLRIPEDRDGFSRALETEFGVKTGVYYPVPLHKLAPFKRYRVGTLPETERAAREVLQIPVHPSLSRRQLEKIVLAINSLARAGA